MDALYDVAVIGAGPGGYAAAVRAAELGLKTVCFDPMVNPDDGESGALGGTCANVGCVPSKALLAASLAYAKARKGSSVFGLKPVIPVMDFDQMQRHRAKAVKDSNRGVAMLFKKAGVEFVPEKVGFRTKAQTGWELKTAGGQILLAKHVIVACGTRPRALPGLQFDEDVVCSNTGALAFKVPPKSLGIIGAGVIGLELGSVWSRLGSVVTVFDMAADVLSFAGKTVSDAARKMLSEQGLQFELGVLITDVQRSEEGVNVTFERDGIKETRTFERLLVAIGRRSAIEDVNPQAVGLAVNPAGIVETDELCRTNLPGVWAIGDIVKGPQLAHKASDEGRAVAERIAGGVRPAHVSPIPSVVYTHPEFAWVGLSSDAAQEAGMTVRKGRATFAHNAMARACNETAGFVELVCEESTGRLVGAQVVGAAAGDLVSALAQAMAFGATDEDLSLVIWPHPGMSETIQEAAFASLRASEKKRE